MVWHLPEPYGHVPFCKPEEEQRWPATVPTPCWPTSGEDADILWWFVQGLHWEWEGGQTKHTQNFRDQSLVPDCQGREKTNK